MSRSEPSSFERRVPSLARIVTVVIAIAFVSCGGSATGCEQLTAVQDAATTLAEFMTDESADRFSEEVAALRDAVDAVDAEPDEVMGASVAELEQAVGNLEDIERQLRGGAPLSDMRDTIVAANKQLARAVASLRATPPGQSCDASS